MLRKTRLLTVALLALALTVLVASAARAQTAPATDGSSATSKGDEDPQRTRYLYAPSALLLHRGEVVFSQRELVYSEVDFGITDHLSVLAGSALPLWFAPDGLNFVAAVKAGGSVGRYLHLAAGAETFALPIPGQNMAFGFVFGTATVGTDDDQLTVSAGKPFVLTGGGNALGDAIVVVAGSARLTDHVGVMTENWIFPGETYDTNDAPIIGSLGLRLMTGPVSGDIGFVHIPGVDVPLPWVNFSYRIR